MNEEKKGTTTKYLPTDIRKQVVKDAAIASMQIKDGSNTWMKKNCSKHFKEEDNNHLSAFTAYLNEKYPPGCPDRFGCNQKPIHASTVTAWMQNLRNELNAMNKALPESYAKISVPKVLKDGTLSDATKKARKAERERERMIARHAELIAWLPTKEEEEAT